MQKKKAIPLRNRLCHRLGSNQRHTDFQNEESYPVDCRYHCINNLII